MSLKFVTAFLRSSGENAMIILEEAGCNQIAVVDKQALLDVASPPRADETRLQENIELFCDIVRAKHCVKDIASDGRIHISAGDVSKWKSDPGHRH
ncbi:hypothetical protein [Rhizobium sullae]|uniref:DUF1488 domain-containing protein n=1 Tax=Rhizobium sullae TaxID=50338 RepID=A0A2N0DB44_RHISU|nr:hypothetical protein [Rhizobium sullae]PKA43311.1 hypothetical protein CWR43_10015 [Rhizobium sullae]TCU13326.1 hypothetical protein EV132_11224 [Rhizobium sullae]UWU18737.1 hypothetical protein N2599_26475 [Rhizobium sullae]